jgi:integrase
MAAYKDKAGRWRWRTRVTNPFTGQEERLSGSAPLQLNTKSAAKEEEKAAVERFRLNPADKPAPIAPLVKEAAEAFYKDMLANPQHAKSYVDKVELNLRVHIIADLGERRIDELTDEVLKEYKVTLLNKPVTERGRWVKRARLAQAALAQVIASTKKPETEAPAKPRPTIKPRTVIDILQHLHMLVSYAHEKKHIQRMPKFPKAPKVEEELPVFLDFEEERKVYAAAENDDERMALMFAIRTGARQSEQTAFPWTNIDWANKQIRILQAHKKGGNIGPTKGKNQRVVDVDDTFLAALKEYRNHIRPLVFSKADGSPLKNKDFRVMISRALKKAGITKHVTWHDLRHTFGSQQAMAGVPLRRIQKWMGHKSIKTTERYAHLSTEGGKTMVSLASAARGW